MCLSMPARVVEIGEEKCTAIVDYLGSRIMVGVELLEAVETGQYVLVHAGEAIQVIDEEQAIQSLDLWKELLE
ncbi:HypC/HybG/HupF family hydrogenase formation chaperone [Thalassobacillus devorans]|uniref:HypC/HybG/HupF family hydrogenase formation chaperone n=1 Tax=Thalassobacillus devorans TaxID=279813 RepID=UPI0004908B56|nr:HypC/HybG/HupF family hydrogenase formation chaperone [Thalassobacillus devorans]